MTTGPDFAAIKARDEQALREAQDTLRQGYLSPVEADRHALVGMVEAAEYAEGQAEGRAIAASEAAAIYKERYEAASASVLEKQQALERRTALLTRVLGAEWGQEYGPDAARLLDEIKQEIQ